jgi:hypothetical protein
MAKLAGFTESTTKKFWPPVKRKVMEEHQELAKYLTGTASSTTAAPKAAGKKRKAADAEADADAELDPMVSDTAEGNGTDSKPKKAPAKGKRGKKIKTEDAEAENKSAEGGDGKREFVYKGFVVDWLNKTDEPAGEEEEV